MINITTLILIMFVFTVYILVTFTMVPKIRKLLKIWLYILVFIALIFPEFKGIGNLKLNIEIYAIVLAGIEVFEMILKYIVDDKQTKGKSISKKIKEIYESM